MATPNRILDEKTLIPLGVVVVLFGGVAWLTALHAQASENTKKLDHIQQVIYTELKDMNQRLSQIEGSLKRKSKED